VQHAQPECRFVGADPAEANRPLYEPLGTFHHIAVGAENGTFEANVFGEWREGDAERRREDSQRASTARRKCPWWTSSPSSRCCPRPQWTCCCSISRAASS